MASTAFKRTNPGTAMGALGLLFGFLALVVALSSSADAGSRHAFIRKGDIAPGAVTAKTLANGAVHPKALAKGAVTTPKLKAGAVKTQALAKDAVTTAILAKGSVTATALGADSVTAGAIAPSSVYGGALGSLAVHTVQITDQDAVAENGTWTASNTEAVTCAPGERLISGGFVFTNPGNREVGFLQALPFINGDTQGVTGRFTSNSGGSAVAEVEAVCLK
jgi:hypothetical protein